jgi:predicted SnoaL-like aldol condensation-catalyzing enzyme
MKPTSVNVVVVDSDTGDFVPFRLEKSGEIRIVSTNILHTVDNCIVTTWENITQKNMERKIMNEKDV